MKYIATQVTGYALMTRDIEVEISEVKLEAELEEETHDRDEDWWADKPADEQWIDFETFADNFIANDKTIQQKADAIIEEWEALPDCIKVRDYDTDDEQVNEWDDEPYVKACKQWLRSKGWAPLPDDSGVWFRKNNP